ncbi:MAG: SCP2 sterol-binding domain-containing protein, partial [Chloroflexi bacterium]|nr:SCP2 sterol-binding domain-containing protein [Chloroflexota bacterium]
GEPLEPPVRYRFVLDDPVTDSYDVVVTGDNFRLFPSDDKEANVTFRCDTNSYILFGLGRMPLARSVRRGVIELEGDEALAAKFSEWFRPL